MNIEHLNPTRSSGYFLSFVIFIRECNNFQPPAICVTAPKVRERGFWRTHPSHPVHSGLHIHFFSPPTLYNLLSDVSPRIHLVLHKPPLAYIPLPSAEPCFKNLHQVDTACQCLFPRHPPSKNHVSFSISIFPSPSTLGNDH